MSKRAFAVQSNTSATLALFSRLTDVCRLRCIHLLRNTEKHTVASLYTIADADLVARLNEKRKPALVEAKYVSNATCKHFAGSLAQDLERIGADDQTFALSTLANLVASFERVDVEPFVRELIEVCFLEEHTRDLYYKVGELELIFISNYMAYRRALRL